MKKLLTILCLFLFAYMQAGYLIHFAALRIEAKKEWKRTRIASLPESSFERFDWSSICHEVQWEEEGKEFWLHGKLYDIAIQKNIDRKTYLYCINDSKEEDIVVEQGKATASSSAHTSGKTTSFKFSLPDILVTNEADETIQSAVLKNNYGFYLVRNIHPFATGIFQPPQV